MILTPFLHLKYQIVRGEATSMNKNNLNALKCYTSQNRVCTKKMQNGIPPKIQKVKIIITCVVFIASFPRILN